MKTKSSTIKKSFSLLLAVCAFIMISASSFGQNTNFSGTFKFNEGKSNAGEGRMRAASQIVVTQTANTLNTVSKSTGFNGEERVQNSKYTLDGKECENEGFMNNVSKSVATWSADGKTLTIRTAMTFERNGQKMEIKSSEAWSLSEDGSTLTLNVNRTTPNGDMQQKLVYDKAN
ncbi:MAG TPA: hypothetical protein VJY41_00975 [Prolixibacteraceae bacterium]|nr:hypothetical protein [Prolixibacteraceae bacterium]